MESLSAALANRYRIEGELGHGGMATVYLAHDIRHDRKVAIKVLRPELSAILGGERFLHEIKTTANLQHPHIVPLFDSGILVTSRESRVVGGDAAVEEPTTHDPRPASFLYYVMPYIDGESLRQRLVRDKQLPVEEAVRIAREAADALHYAHQRGIVHRDIKPENILLHGGHAMVADFGIAIALSRSDSTTRLTETGMSLGTPQYMAPEQAMGEREITPRADIYALGCTVYEMLTGEPPFVAPTAQAIVARIMTEDPRAIIAQRRTVPPGVEEAVFKALEKLPADRFNSAAEFSAALNDGNTARRLAPGFAGATGSAARLPRASLARSKAGLRSVGVVALLFGGLAAWGWLRPSPRQAVIRYRLGMPPDQAMVQGDGSISMALSPDGRRMVYVGRGDPLPRLWVRESDQLDATPLPGTEEATNPFFSPDGRQIAFSVGDLHQLKVIPASGGPEINLATAGPGAGGGGVWSADGWIHIDTEGGLSRIRPSGGTPELVVPYDTTAHEVGFAYPDVLPGDNALIYRSRRNIYPSDFDVVAFDLRNHTRHVLAKGVMARYVAPGYLVYLRSDGTLLAAPFDPDRLAITGPAVTLLEGVMMETFGSADLAISKAGTLAYASRRSAFSGTAEVVFVDRDSSVHPLSPPLTFTPGRFYALSLSPDGRRLAFDIADSLSSDIWVKQLPSGPLSRLTFSGRYSGQPSWTPDGQSVLYGARPNDSIPTALWRRRADGSAPPELALKVAGKRVIASGYTPDGRWLVYVVSSDSAHARIYARKTSGDTTPVALTTGAGYDDGPVVSPDGKWLAYHSDESGRQQVYVVPFPAARSGRWQVSTDGGTAARWSHSGRSLFFESDIGELMEASIRPGASFSAGTPRVILPPALVSIGVPYYDITPDDRRFVRVRPAQDSRASAGAQVVMVEHWTEELRDRMRGRRW